MSGVSKAKSLVARLLVSPPMAAAVSAVSRHRIRSHDLVFDTADPIVSRRVEAKLRFNLYEGAEIRFARRHLRGMDTLVDLGSSLGFTASHAVHAMGPKGRLVSVEANPALIGFLRRTLEEHARGWDIRIENAAIAYGTETATLQFSDATMAGRLSELGTTVPATTLSALLERHGIGDYALLADIEGAEAQILTEDAGALSGCRRAVLELHDTPDLSVAEMIERFGACGLDLLHRRGPVVALARRT